MTRVDPLPPKEWPPQMRDALAAMNPPVRRHPPLATEGRPKGLNVLGAMAHHPELATAFFTFNGHLLSATSLTPRQREMLVLRTAVLRQSEYEWAQHVVIAGDVGISREEVAQIAWGPDSTLWSESDAALLRTTWICRPTACRMRAMAWPISPQPTMVAVWPWMSGGSGR